MILLLLSCAYEGLQLQPESLNEENMVSFDESSYMMGFPDTDPGPYGNSWKETAQPQHSVVLSAFTIDKFEITVQQYSDFLTSLHNYHPEGSIPHYHPLQPITLEDGIFLPLDGEEQRPMRYVSWYNAATYCSYYGKRLPTEAEWELVAKGNDIDNPRAYPWSPDGGADCKKAVYFTNRILCEEYPAVVGSRSPEGDTPEGVSDLAGNVSEWVFDWFEIYPEEEVTDPRGPDTGEHKIVRGGGFRETSDALRSTDRVSADPLSRSEGIGFRCARSKQ
jgi:formylglycine-generating enzyme required for sulfatase activity